jgi:predicted ABC-type exoprotein transport system permease subunit
MLTTRFQHVLTIIGMPLVFNVMAMRSLVRIWAVMTGSCWKPGMPWENIEQLEMVTYTMDLEVALFFQFYGIWRFGLLCTNFLEHSRYIHAEDEDAGRQYKRTLALTSVQGVYAFVLVGALRGIFDLAVSWMQEKPQYKEMADQLEVTVLSKVGPIFIFVTLLVMVNMVLVSRVRDIKEPLGNANLKFLGTRLLLLIAQIQPKVLAAITVGSPLYEKVSSTAEKLHLQERFGLDLSYWTFNGHQAELAHASLLNIECIIIAVFTIFFWQLDAHQREALMFEHDFPSKGSSRVAAREATDYQRLPAA